MVVAVFAFTATFAGNSDLFSYDKQALNDEFVTIDNLESYVCQNDVKSYDEILTSNQALSDELLAAGFVANPSDLNFGIDDVDWTSFAWGFCCWPVGFFTVLLKEETTKEQKLSFWIGCGVSALMSFGSSLMTALVR